MKVSQIVSAYDIAQNYRNRINDCKQALKWELISSGETQRAEWLRKEIEKQKEALNKHLDCEV